MSAGKVGMSPEALGATIASVLPGLIDKLTPNGQVPAPPVAQPRGS